MRNIILLTLLVIISGCAGDAITEVTEITEVRELKATAFESNLCISLISGEGCEGIVHPSDFSKDTHAIIAYAKTAASDIYQQLPATIIQNNTAGELTSFEISPSIAPSSVIFCGFIDDGAAAEVVGCFDFKVVYIPRE